ncbi:PREDICTED: probable alanine--tRNA ligase, chloroplastic-like [Fragaria vesca subsp. vesca]
MGDDDHNSKDLLVSGDSIRRRFLKFFASQGHEVLPSASLVPRPDDPTVLLTTAGMLQFKPIFLGHEERKVEHLGTIPSSKCLATSVSEITSRGKQSDGHGSFRLKKFGIPADRLWVSVFQDDDEAFEIWHHEVGVPVEHIQRMGEEDNFWTSGVTGPCGPCSEIYYDFHPERGYLDATSMMIPGL